jgi:hypothetical protein
VARERETFSCPQCGDAVPVGSSSCRSCGSDASTGWAREGDAGAVRDAQDLDLPQTHLDDDAYEEFVREDLGGGTTAPSRTSRTALVMVVVFVLAVAAVLAWLTAGRR